MSPGKLHNDLHTKREINGPRPFPLNVKKHSNFIHKSSSSSSSTTNQRRHPVIIYTHSPKIIHAQARDFMALVQRLTGLSHSHADEEVTQPRLQQSKEVLSSWPNSDHNNNVRAFGREDNELVTNENCGCSIAGDAQVGSSSSVITAFGSPYRYFSNIPLFTPHAMDFFRSPRLSDG